MAVKKETQRRFDAFVDDVGKTTGYDKRDIVKILKAEGIEGFKPSDYTNLRAIVLATHAKREDLAEKIKAHNDAFPKIEHECPVCNGNKVSDGRGGWPWKCSVGGIRCHLVFRSATIMEQFHDRKNGTDPATFDKRREATAQKLLESYVQTEQPQA